MVVIYWNWTILPPFKTLTVVSFINHTRVIVIHQTQTKSCIWGLQSSVERSLSWYLKRIPTLLTFPCTRHSPQPSIDMMLVAWITFICLIGTYKIIYMQGKDLGTCLAVVGLSNKWFIKWEDILVLIKWNHHILGIPIRNDAANHKLEHQTNDF